MPRGVVVTADGDAPPDAAAVDIVVAVSGAVLLLLEECSGRIIKPWVGEALPQSSAPH